MELENQKNAFFDRTHIHKRFNAVLTDVFRLTSKKGFSISSDDFDEITHAERIALRMVRESFAMMKEQSIERRRNLERYSSIRILSLGEDCFGRIVPAQWGLRKPAKLGERSVPFDTAVHPIDGLIDIIRSDFQFYIDPDYLRYSDVMGCCFNSRYLCRWNHNRGAEYAENDFQLLRETQQKRIEVFRAAMQSANPTVLIFHADAPSEQVNDKIIDLYDALHGVWGMDNKIIININTWSKDATIPLPTSHDGIRTIDIHQPRDAYKWHRAGDAYSKGGYEMEKSIVQRIAEIVQLKFPHELQKTDWLPLNLKKKNTSFLSKPFATLKKLVQLR